MTDAGPRRYDPQIVLNGTLKQTERSDVIVFSLSFLLVDLTFIVTIPAEGNVHAPVYVKFRLQKRTDEALEGVE